MKATRSNRSYFLTLCFMALGITVAAMQWQTRPASGAAFFAHAPLPSDGQGLYESCDPRGAACLADLDQQSAAGFSVVLNYSQFAPGVTINDELAYAGHASQHGMKVIWPIRDFVFGDGNATDLQGSFASLSDSMKADGKCPDYSGTDYTFVKCFARMVSPSAGTWGYYVGDELPASQEPVVRHMVDAVYEVDPAHPRLFVAGQTGDSVNESALWAFGYSYCDGYQCHSTANVELQDYYPIGTTAGRNPGPPTAAIAAREHTMVNNLGAGSGMVLQAHSLTEYPSIYGWCNGQLVNCPYPTESDMRTMRDAVIAQGPARLILWYSYFDISHSDNSAQHWADLARAAIDKPVAPPAAPPPPAATATPAPQSGQPPVAKPPVSAKLIPPTPVQVQVTDQSNRPIPGATVHLTTGSAVTTNRDGLVQLPSRSQVDSIHIATEEIPSKVAINADLAYTIQVDLPRGKLAKVQAYTLLSEGLGWLITLGSAGLVCAMTYLGAKRYRRDLAVEGYKWRSTRSRREAHRPSLPQSLLGQHVGTRDDYDDWLS